METGTAQQKITLAFINEKSPILDLVCDSLTALGFEITFRSETIEDGLYQLSTAKEYPKVCIVDLDFYEHKILSQLQKLRLEYPTVKLLSHSDIDNEKVGKALLDIGFSSCLLVGSDVDDFKRIINRSIMGR
ncbi:DNA-binding response regulator [Sphingobacterium sp. NPDC055346]